jgi:hypothetical protein
MEKTLNVSALVKARFETPPAGCAPYTARFEIRQMEATILLGFWRWQYID